MYDGVLWESADGVQWQRLPADRLFQGELDTAFGRLHATPDGLLLIGSKGPYDALTYVEASGLLGRIQESAADDRRPSEREDHDSAGGIHP